MILLIHQAKEQRYAAFKLHVYNQLPINQQAWHIMVTKTSMHLPVHHETSVAKLAVVQQTRPNDQTGLSQNERGNIADQNTRSWKPKTCTATRGRYLWLQKRLSGKMAVRGTFLGSAPDTWVHFLYFSHSGRITQSSPSSLITSCLKTSRRCVMSLNRVRGNELMVYFVRTTPTCLQTHFTLRTVKLEKLQHKPETERSPSN